MVTDWNPLRYGKFIHTLFYINMHECRLTIQYAHVLSLVCLDDSGKGGGGYQRGDLRAGRCCFASVRTNNWDFYEDYSKT